MWLLHKTIHTYIQTHTHTPGSAPAVESGWQQGLPIEPPGGEMRRAAGAWVLWWEGEEEQGGPNLGQNAHPSPETDLTEERK